MSPGLLVELAASLAGVGVLVAVSYWLGGWRSVRVTEGAAAERLAFDEPDFRVGEWLIGADGKSAAALSDDGKELALVFALGDSFATRRMKRAGVRASRNGAAVEVLLGEPTRRAVRVAAADTAAAEHWLLRLTRSDL